MYHRLEHACSTAWYMDVPESLLLEINTIPSRHVARSSVLHRKEILVIYSNSQIKQIKIQAQHVRSVDLSLRPEEEDLQDLYENNNYRKELDSEDFALDRGWWFCCRTCGGETRLRTKHPYCRHCGFSQKTNGSKGAA